MDNEQKDIADRVVKTFRSQLDSDINAAIGEHNFDALNSLVREAIAENAESIIDQLGDLLKQIKAETERRPLEL
ncbi:MAG: hypothetical protein OEY09_10815 [Gammaproteobacteria bacterium]|nr:hypothetical protein [Gammaproteobacteria bacterium]